MKRTLREKYRLVTEIMEIADKKFAHVEEADYYDLFDLLSIRAEKVVLERQKLPAVEVETRTA